MKIWLISYKWPGKYTPYDVFESAVVAAETSEVASKIHPSGYDEWNHSYKSWAPSPDDIDVEYIGEAAADMDAGRIICASFNAG